MTKYLRVFLVIFCLLALFTHIVEGLTELAYQYEFGDVQLYVRCVDEPFPIFSPYLICSSDANNRIRVLEVRYTLLLRDNPTLCTSYGPYSESELPLTHCNYIANHTEMHLVVGECNTKHFCAFTLDTRDNKKRIRASSGVCNAITTQFLVVIKYECHGLTSGEKVIPIHEMMTSYDTVYDHSVMYIVSHNYPKLDNEHYTSCYITYVPQPGDRKSYRPVVQYYDLTTTTKNYLEYEGSEGCTYYLQWRVTNPLGKNLVGGDTCNYQDRGIGWPEGTKMLILDWQRIWKAADTVGRLWFRISFEKQDTDENFMYDAPGSLNVRCEPSIGTTTTPRPKTTTTTTTTTPITTTRKTTTTTMTIPTTTEITTRWSSTSTSATARTTTAEPQLPPEREPDEPTSRSSAATANTSDTTYPPTQYIVAEHTLPSQRGTMKDSAEKIIPAGMLAQHFYMILGVGCLLLLVLLIVSVFACTVRSNRGEKIVLLQA